MTFFLYWFLISHHSESIIHGLFNAAQAPQRPETKSHSVDQVSNSAVRVSS